MQGLLKKFRSNNKFIVERSLTSCRKSKMVKPQFSDLKVDLWVHRGRICVSNHNLCLFHGSVESGSPILDALNELRLETRPAQRKLTLAGCSRKRALTNLRLIVDAEREDLRVMNIRHDTDSATIEMTDDGLTRLIDACTAWLGGAEDFGVSPRQSALKTKELGALDRESGELWFWGPGYDGP
ncbi:MAG: hypothetical protein HQ582_07755 [Planctomycetes bacterium]|nr:hypothetical protein [Planctomycetota bacterium]